ncbi:lysozyme inhibitor LprI family protein [Lichenifustis flavocetrariae]|uniref:Lysozyme inhibitor LprI family protein n=1 Tax=Lichenifustis flavocetrariae TaxID=2949735 RepID=A0AA42CLH7_9HYPH|nr:lysozyme inhibitor LprI family protein [Lichenifustis flavocetrariae]MCW6511598.1 lysozyme inhibitor LprI family protein [Lichenifustis flavocetrariae]
MRHVAMFILALSLPRLAFAAAGPCSEPMPQQDMNVCMSRAVNEADSILNRVYEQLKNKLDDNGKRNLVSAEWAWITFRDRECELRSGYDAEHLDRNGTIVPFLVGECKLDLANQRMTDLVKELKCPGGDLSCPQ